MNYAVNSATAVAFSCRRPSIPTIGKLVDLGSPTTERRITINVGGERFQTYENTLARYPDTLLGSPERRRGFYNERKNELVFPLRNKNVFNAILFFYQARILARPVDIPLQIFLEEINFFDLARYSDEIPKPAMKTKYVTANDNLRFRVWNFMENPRSKVANAFAQCHLLFVFTWLFILCLETSDGRPETERNTTRANALDPEKGYYGWASDTWFILDTIFVIWFTVDYLLHVTCEPSLRSYILSPLGVIDLVTILPYYITLITQAAGATLSPQMGLLRFLRVFRLFKATRYSSAFRILLGSLTSSAKDFPVWFILMVLHIVFFSSILYYVESEVGNPQFSNIPDVMYFTVITMCAVGYGDAVPQSAMGKMVTSLAALSGIVIVYCIPAPTLKTNFNRLNELHKTEKKERERLKCNGGLHNGNHH